MRPVSNILIYDLIHKTNYRLINSQHSTVFVMFFCLRIDIAITQIIKKFVNLVSSNN